MGMFPDATSLAKRITWSRFPVNTAADRFRSPVERGIHPHDAAPGAEVAALVNSIRTTNLRPRALDARLSAISRRELGADLDSPQKARVRAAFLRALETRLESPDALTQHPEVPQPVAD